MIEVDERPARRLAQPPRDDDGRGYRPKHALEEQPYKAWQTNVALWMVLLLLSGFVVGTTASFRAQTSEAVSKFGTDALVEPSGQSLTLAGADLTMQVSSFGSVAIGSGTVGLRWRYYWPTGVSSQGNAPTCSTATSSYADSTRDLGSSVTVSKTVAYPTSVSGVSTDGRWMCVMSLTTYPATDPVPPAQQWLSQMGNPVGPVQLGHVIKSVQLQNGGASTSGTLSTGDKVIITFNQPVDATARPDLAWICARGAGGGNRILLGRPSGNCNKTAETANVAVQLGNLHWLGTGNLADEQFNVTDTWTASNVVELVLTSGTMTLSNCTVLLSNSGCFQLSTQYVDSPGTALESATGAKALCTAQPAGAPDSGICWPNSTGRP